MSYPTSGGGPGPVTSAAPPASKSAGGLEYLRAYQYVFENPEWATTILWGFLIFFASAFLPGVGILALLLIFGYQFVVIDSLLATGGTRYPTFDINRFGDYFMRGVWPFLAVIMMTIPLSFILVLFYLGTVVAVVGGAAIGGEEVGGLIALVIVMLAFGLFFLVLAGLGILAVPLILRAGLSQDFGETFRFEWIRDFIRKMWLEILLANLFLVMSALVLFPLGCVALCVGMYAAQMLVAMAQTHLLYQLYALYLSRGGTPVIPKPKPLPPVPLPPAQPMP